MEIYKKVENFVKGVFKDSQVNSVHSERTAYWVKQLKPDADEAMLVAAIAHDIERGFRDAQEYQSGFKESGDYFKGEEYLDNHQNGGADIICDYLKKQGVDNKFIDRARYLVSKHEVGGDKDQNIIKDADSISFFENNTDYLIDVLVEKIGKESVKEKFDWSYDRITSQKAKDICVDWYKQALKELKKKQI